MRTLYTNTAIVVAIVAGLIGSKFVAAWCVKRIYRYSWTETLTMWSLSLPQVAATLAAALVGYQAGLLPEAIFNSVIVLMLTTSTLGPVLTRRYARKIPVPPSQFSPSQSQELSPSSLAAAQAVAPSASVLVPISNPKTEVYLIEMASWLAKQWSCRLLPLAIAQPTISLAHPTFTATVQRLRQHLKEIVELAQSVGVAALPLLRVDQDIATGICHTCSEQTAQLVVMGYSDMTTLQARWLGSVVDQVLHTSPCPVAVMNLRRSPLMLERILVPLWDAQPHRRSQIRFAQQVAAALRLPVMAVYVHSLQNTAEEQQLLSFWNTPGITDGEIPSAEVKLVDSPQGIDAVLQTSQATDLVVLHGRDTIPSPEILAPDWGTHILQSLKGSFVLFTESDL